MFEKEYPPEPPKPRKVGSYEEIINPNFSAATMAQLAGAHATDVCAYHRGDKIVLVSKDNGLWHISISCKKRYPSWDEIKEARYLFAPDDCYMAIILPPKAEYVNVCDTCFHLHELKRDEIPKKLTVLFSSGRTE